MSTPFISTGTINGKRLVAIEGLVVGKELHFDHTPEGCREAGAALFNNGAENWLNSSDVDGDTENKIQEGWQAAYDKKNRQADFTVEILVLPGTTPRPFYTPLTNKAKWYALDNNFMTCPNDLVNSLNKLLIQNGFVVKMGDTIINDLVAA